MKQKDNSNREKSRHQSNRLEFSDRLWLLGWLAIGIVLRFSNIGDKSPSSIEIATLGFSLGHGFAQIPIDEIISPSTLLAPLQFDRAITSADVVTRLLTESTHPPLYFWLTHWWLRLFSHHGELVSLTAARSLSAIFGALTIPAIFSLSWLNFRDRLTAHLTAILMAISPYGIYLAQEARHYTISVFWIIISLICWTIAINSIRQRRQLPWSVAIVWILINAVAIATHYFFSLCLIVQASILVGLWWQQNSTRERDKFRLRHWWRILLVAWGTLAAGLVWLPIASSISSNELTSWISTSYQPDLILLPLLRIWGWLVTMIALLPIEGVSIAIAIISSAIVLLGLIWVIPALLRGWQSLMNKKDNFPTKALSSYCLGAIILYLLIIYGYGKDISLAARYHFIYFPVVIILLGAILAQLWQNQKIIRDRSWFAANNKQAFVAVILIGLLGSLTVVNNLGFQKSRQSNLLAKRIFATTTPNIPTLIATSYTTHSQLREFMAIALSGQINSSSIAATPQLLLLEQSNHEPEGYIKFRDIVLAQPKPLDVWSINLKINPAYFKKDLNCKSDRPAELADAGYKNRLYHCQELNIEY